MNRFLLAALFVALQCSIVRADTTSVGDLGDLNRIDIRGENLLSAKDIRHALFNDSEFQLASTPTAPIDQLLKVTKTELELGYQHWGFPNAKIEVAIDQARNQLVIKIDEGARLLAGNIQIAGSKQIDSKQLEAFFLKGYQPGKFPLTLEGGVAQIISSGDIKDPKPSSWKPEAPAPLDHVTLEEFDYELRMGLASQGFFETKFTLQTKPRGDHADLVVSITDEGQRAVLGEIEVLGTNRNKPADVTAFLGLETGKAISVNDLQTLQTKLWNSARFWRHTLTLSPLPNEPAKTKLRIELAEHAHVPTLSQPLTPEDQAILRCRDWLEASLLSGSDIVIELNGNGLFKAQAILSNKKGLLLHLRDTRQPKSPHAATAPSFLPDFFAGWNTAVVISADRVGLYDIQNQEKFEAAGKSVVVGTTVNVRLVPDPNPAKLSRYMFLGGGISSESGQPKVKFDLILAPVCALDFYRNQTGTKIDAQIDNGVFTLKVEKMTFRCDAKTGQLIDLAYQAEDGTVHITLQNGALQRESNLIAQVVPAQAGAKPENGLQTFIAALTHYYCLFLPNQTSESRLAVSRALRKLTVPAAGVFSDLFLDNNSDLDIPFDARSAVMQANAQLGVLMVAAPWLDKITTRGSWPWTISREALLLVAGRAKYTHLEAGRLIKSPDLGPLGCLAIAKAYTAASDPVTARIFAKRGLELLTFEQFSKDCNTLFAGHAPQAQFMAAMMNSLSNLSDDEITSMEILTGKPMTSVLKTLAKFARQSTKDSPDPFPANLQKAIWDAGMKDVLETNLKALAQVESKKSQPSHND